MTNLIQISDNINNQLNKKQPNSDKANKSFRMSLFLFLLLIWMQEKKKKRVPSHLCCGWAQCDHLHPRETQRKREPTRTEACPHTNQGLHFIHERQGEASEELLYVWSGCEWGLWRTSCLELNGSPELQRVTCVRTGLWRSAKSCCRGCGRCETAHSPFFTTHSHTETRTQMLRKIKRVGLFSDKWKHFHAIKEFFSPVHM